MVREHGHGVCVCLHAHLQDVGYCGASRAQGAEQVFQALWGDAVMKLDPIALLLIAVIVLCCICLIVLRRKR